MTNLVLYVHFVQHLSALWIAQHPLCLPGLRKNYSSTGIHYNDPAYMITLEMFSRAFYILGVDLTPDKEADEEHIILPVWEMYA